jgi:hypothetical protein
MDSAIKLGPVYADDDDDCEVDCDDDASGEPKAGGMRQAGAEEKDDEE